MAKAERSMLLKKTVREKGDLEGRIISAALEVLKDKASHGVTYREIAAEAGVSHMAPYRYFRSKEEILARIAEDGQGFLTTTMKEVLIAFPIHPEKQLFEAGFRYFDFAKQFPVHFRIMFSECPLKDIEGFESLRKASERTFDVFLQLIHNCQMKGVLSAKRNAEELAFFLWSYIHGSTILYLDVRLEVFKTPIDPKRAIDRGLKAFIKGLQDS